MGGVVLPARAPAQRSIRAYPHPSRQAKQALRVTFIDGLALTRLNVQRIDRSNGASDQVVSATRVKGRVSGKEAVIGTKEVEPTPSR